MDDLLRMAYFTSLSYVGSSTASVRNQSFSSKRITISMINKEGQDHSKVQFKKNQRKIKALMLLTGSFLRVNTPGDRRRKRRSNRCADDCSNY